MASTTSDPTNAQAAAAGRAPATTTSTSVLTKTGSTPVAARNTVARTRIPDTSTTPTCSSSRRMGGR